MQNLQFPEQVAGYTLVSRVEDGNHITARYYKDATRTSLPSLEGLTQVEKVALSRNTPSIYYVTVSVDRDRKNIFGGYGFSRFVRRGRSVFPKNDWIISFSVRGNRIYGDAKAGLDFPDAPLGQIVLTVLGAECLVSFKGFIKKPQLLKIVRGTITNPEALVRDFFKRNLRLDNIDWKAYSKGYFSLMQVGSPLDILAVCGRSGFDYLMRKFAYGTIDFNSRMVGDLIDECIQLDRTMNPRWSEKRMLAEHQEMTQALMKRQIDSVPAKQYYSASERVCGRSLEGEVIGDSKRLFLEGSTMHHCIYTCYRQSIEKGSYLAIAVKAPERCTTGIRIGSQPDSITIDQIHTIYNGCVSGKTKDLLDEWVADNKEFLFSLAEERRELWNQERLSPVTIEDDQEGWFPF